MNPQLANGEIYHVFNRGVDKRKIFMDKKDRYRFVHDLFEFNDTTDALPSNVRLELRKPAQFQRIDTKHLNIGLNAAIKPRKLLVKILVWSLMPNHYHLLLEQTQDNGISLFMKKLNGGFSRYFNQRYKRNGALFQGKFKAVLVKSDAHFAHLPFYIHCNPLDQIEPGWREGKIKNYQKAKEFMESYRFSSHLDYLGKKNFASVSQREFLLGIFGGPQEYKKQCYEWLKAMSPEQSEKIIEKIYDVILD